MGGAGFVIIFVAAFVGCLVWSMIYLTFASHYFLTTITETSAGHDEIEYPSEGIMDWWWKPFFCLWILSIWVVPLTVVVGPLLAASPLAFVIGLTICLLVMYPLSLMSALYAQSWFVFLHPEFIWRLVRRYGLFGYVQLMSSLSIAVGVGLVAAAFGHTFLWALPASFVLPTALLLYARHWGRYSWVALNFAAPGAKKPKKPRAATTEAIDPWATPELDEEQIPEMEVEEIDPSAEAISAGLPPMFPTAVQSGVPATTDGIVAGMPTKSTASVEEDEWATNKSPYGLIEEEAKPAVQTSVPAYDREPESDANKPLVLSDYYDEKARKEKKERAKRERELRMMRTTTKKPPSFQEAFLRGVWEFMIYSRTLRIWVNLVAMTAVELLLILLVVQTWPQL
jgi:hypothetical protein